MKRIFVIDWILIVVFIMSSISGFGLHLAGHNSCHEVWHNWAVFHVLSSILFLIASILHVITHSGWYKEIIRNGIGRKSKVTFALSIIFMLLSITGILLLGVNGPNSSLGLWHYIIGIIATLLAVFHIIIRIPVLCKSLKRIKRSM